MRGKVVRVKEDKGYGFIHAEGGGDYFFHREDQINYEGLLPLGSEVEFEGRKTDKGPRANSVRYIEKLSPIESGEKYNPYSKRNTNHRDYKYDEEI